MACLTKKPCKSVSCYTFWTWLLAILLAIYLFWHWQHGHRPAHAMECCNASQTAAAPKPAAVPFAFQASSSKDFTATGEPVPTWANKAAELNAWLKGGSDLALEGNAKSVNLTGAVESEEVKQAKGTEAQAFFGAATLVNNQLVVKPVVAEQSVVEQPVAVPTAPPAAKLYFDSGKTTAPADASQTLAATIDWLNGNSDAKAVISGYSDPRGNLKKNEALSKNRAKAVRDLLKSAGIDEARVELRKPESVETEGDLAEARRVEVTVE